MSEYKNVFITDRFSIDSLAFLQSHSFLKIQKSNSPTHLQGEDIANCHALLIRSRTIINEELLKKARNLQVIITGTSGFDHIDLAATQKWGITVMNTPDANIESATNLTWSLVLASMHHLTRADDMARGADWARERLIGKELSGRTLGVIGLGRIGKRVAQIGRAFGMHIYAYDPYLTDTDFINNSAERMGLSELMKSSDVATLHVPWTEETNGMIHQHLLEEANRNLVLVNCSRGSVVKEADLVLALEKNWIAGAALDVFEKEPLPELSRLRNFPQLIMTPHIGANTEDAFHKASQLSAEKLLKFFFDGSTSDTLPPRAPWFGATKVKSS